MIFDDVKQKIDEGTKGLNEGIHMGYQRLHNFIPGIQQSTYYLIGGELGTGKSAFVDEGFVYNPYEHIIKEKPETSFHILYFSLEIDKVRKIAKAIARRVFHKYGKLVDINYVLSKGRNRISEEIYNHVLSECDYFYKLEEYVTFYDKPENPTGIWKTAIAYSQENGTWVNKKNIDGEFVPSDYKPNNPNKTTVIIVDHVGLMRNERGFNKKQNIDKLSEYCIILRNKCRFSPVLIQQLNRSMSSAERFTINRVEPQLSDFKDSGNTQEDADLVLGVFNPSRYDIKNFYGYNTALLRNRFRSCHVLKNRDGDADQMLGMGFIGQTGTFFELPKSEAMTASDYDKITKLH